jgi:hypothetical protein
MENKMSNNTLTPEDTKKLKRVIDEGLKLTQDVKDMKEGFKDVVKAVAEELQLKPQIINRAIAAAFKASLEEDKEAMNEVEEILAAVGRA